MKSNKMSRFYNYITGILLLAVGMQDAIAQQPVTEYRVGPENQSSIFSFYNTSPESPDGRLIVFVRCKKEPVGREEFVPGELWVCDRDLQNHRKITDLKGTVAHNGVEAQWIDNDRIAFYDQGRVRIVSANSGQDLLTKKIAAAGLGHYPQNNKILYNVYSGEGDGEPGIYELDCNTFEIKKIIDNKSISVIPLPSHVPKAAITPVKDWRALHCQYAPDGKKIAFRLDVGPFEEGQLQGICNADGSNLKIMIQTLHSIWYDNYSLIGHLRFGQDGKKLNPLSQRYTLVQVDTNGRVIQANLTPRGNHLAVSPDGRRFASETFYKTNPVVFSLYENGHPEKAREIARYNPYNIVWERRFHVNPAFSRDGKRLYYSKPLNEKYAGIFYCEIE